MKSEFNIRFWGFSCLVVAIGVVGCAKRPTGLAPIPPGPYVVEVDDNLSQLALRAYGDMNLWWGLLNANPELAKRPQFSIEPGETINVPAKDKLDMREPVSVFPTHLPTDYIVMPGDSLPFIAKGCYGEKDLWMRIYDANRAELTSEVKENPHLLIAGQVLHIPAKPTEEEAGKLKAAEATAISTAK